MKGVQAKLRLGIVACAGGFGKSSLQLRQERARHNKGMADDQKMECGKVFGSAYRRVSRPELRTCTSFAYIGCQDAPQIT